MGVLNDYVRYLPTLKDSSKAVLTTRKRNIPFGEADLAAIVLSSVPMSWQNQYNLNHSTVPKSIVPCYRTWKPSSESWMKRMVQTSRQKGRVVQPHPKPRVTLSAKRPGGRLVESLRRVAVSSFASNARLTAVLLRCITPWNAIAMTAMASPSRLQQVSPLSPRSPKKCLGMTRIWPSCSPCSRLMQKARRKLVSLRNVRNVTMTPVTVPIVNRKLGTATRS
jgi:hypothetical protein